MYLKLFFITFLIFISGCNTSNFGTGNEERNPPKADGPAMPEEIANVDMTEDCPKVNQDVLILDFKSGWWGGDGGQFFESILTNLQEKCMGKVRLEYHHILKIGGSKKVFPNETGSSGGILDGFFAAGNFDKDLNAYTEIWILSGSDALPSDITISDSKFQNIINAVASGPANVFIGAGHGSITHSNAVTEKLGLGTIFKVNQPAGKALFPTGATITVNTTISIGKGLIAHPLFGSAIKTIADEVTVGSDQGKSDYIIPNQYLQIIGTSTGNIPSIAIAKSGNKKIVIDSGLPRFYSIWAQGGTSSGDTAKYLQRILVYLAKQ